MKLNAATCLCAMVVLTISQPIAPAWATGTGWANGSGACLAQCALDEHICVTNASLGGGGLGDKLRRLGGLPPLPTVADCQVQTEMCEWICEHPARTIPTQTRNAVGQTTTKTGK
jgi:hypothetical protein